MTLAERAHAVRTRDDLIVFLEALESDFQSNSDEWTNQDLPAFLAAMAAWARDMDGFYKNTGVDLASVPPWKALADILMAARVYE